MSPSSLPLTFQHFNALSCLSSLHISLTICTQSIVATYPLWFSLASHMIICMSNPYAMSFTLLYHHLINFVASLSCSRYSWINLLYISSLNLLVHLNCHVIVKTKVEISVGHSLQGHTVIEAKRAPRHHTIVGAVHFPRRPHHRQGMSRPQNVAPP